MPSDDFPYKSRYLDVFGSQMHYVEAGSGDPVVFMHGNPTSSYLWRNIIPYAAEHGRAIAFDLIGMGRSEKPDIEYTFDDQLRYVRGFLDKMGLGSFSLVLHDWGGPLGLTYALENIDRVKSITMMETFFFPSDWAKVPIQFRILFKLFRFPPTGYLLIQVMNFFVRVLMPQSIAPGFKLSKKAREAYLAPYPTVASRKPVAAWPRQIPFSEKDGAWGAACRLRDELPRLEKPTLFFYAEPGAIVNKAIREEVIRLLPKDAEIAHVGRGLHYLQEAHPETIGETLRRFLKQHHRGQSTVA